MTDRTAILRRDHEDPRFKAGDRLSLQQYDPENDVYSGQNTAGDWQYFHPGDLHMISDPMDEALLEDTADADATYFLRLLSEDMGPGAPSPTYTDLPNVPSQVSGVVGSDEVQGLAPVDPDAGNEDVLADFLSPPSESDVKEMIAEELVKIPGAVSRARAVIDRYRASLVNDGWQFVGALDNIMSQITILQGLVADTHVSDASTKNESKMIAGLGAAEDFDENAFELLSSDYDLGGSAKAELRKTLGDLDYPYDDHVDWIKRTHGGDVSEDEAHEFARRAQDIKHGESPA